MMNSMIAAPARPIRSSQHHNADAVRTSFGWMAVFVSNGAVMRVSIGHSTREHAIASLQLQDRQHGSRANDDDRKLLQEVLRRLSDYALGVPDDFRDVPISRPDLTPFGRKVMEHLRQVGYGETVSYRELAERAGSPRAARAVGRVMATNVIPIILPCHRVLASGGQIGGFSAPQGIELKRRLLALEGRSEFQD